MSKEIYEWSTTDGSNNFAIPDGAPEGWLHSDVNNWGRAIMGVLRRWYDGGGEWLHLWHDKTVAKNSDYVVRIESVDATSYMTVGRRIRVAGGASAQFGHITGSSYSGGHTLVTVVLDAAAVLDAATDEFKVHACNESLGEAAFVDVGTAAGEVPLNSDLGTSAVLDTGTGAGELPTNSDLGTASLKNIGIGADDVRISSTLIPVEYYALLDGGDHTFVGGSGEAIVTDTGGIPVKLQVRITAGNGATYYRVFMHLQAQNTSGTAGTMTCKIRMGSLGTIADPIVWQGLLEASIAGGANPDNHFGVSGLKLQPAANDYITVTYDCPRNTTLFCGTSTGRIAWLEAMAMLTYV